MRFRSLGRRWSLALGAAIIVGALAVPAGAGAATVSVTGSTLTYSADGGEENDLSIETAGTVFTVFDNTATVTAGTGCNQRASHRVNCPKAGVNLIQVLARDGDDVVLLLTGTVNANLNGGAGGDVLQSDAGNDTLSLGKSGGGGGFGGEQAFAAAGNDIVNGPTNQGFGAFLSGGPGDDELNGGPGFENLFGDSGADDIRGGDSFDSVSFGGGAGINLTLDNVANDGEPGENDNVHDDVESAFGTSFADTMIGTTGAQQFNSFGGQDTLQGGPGEDSLAGGDGADTLMGEAGSDFLQGGDNPDDLSGGTGSDTVDYQDHFANQVTVTINNAANDGSNGGAEGDNVRTDVENLNGGPNNDSLTGSTLDNQIQGLGGNDTIMGIGGDDSLFGDSTFNSGTFGADTVNGGNGDDDVAGGGGGDSLIGGNDYDFVDYSNFAGSNNLTITTGNNTADDGVAGEGDNVSSSVEGVIGGNGNDDITGASGPNTLRGGPGTDTLNGAGGNDTLQGDRCCSFFADVFNGGDGNDTVTYRDHFSALTVDIDGVADDGQDGGAEGDNVRTNVENVIGGSGSDTITGNNASNTLSGQGGSDTLIGGGSGDTLAGGASFDTLEGQAGKDELNSRGDGNNDTDNCGTESDVAIADSFDTVNPDCETRLP
jgi:Ca2+-binding RTX toxin-like protein